jgi:hypothetical protein
VQKDYEQLSIPWTARETVMWTAGPRFLDEALKSFMNESSQDIRDMIKVYEFEDWQKEVGIHHWTGTWHCPVGEGNCSTLSKLAVKPTDGNEKGVDFSKFCSAVPRTTGAFARISVEKTFSLNASKDVCFVHVGKCGGESIVAALKTLQADNKIRHVVQLHGKHVRVLGDMSLSLPGPVAGHSQERCVSTGNMLVWLRDPVSRFVSLWNFWADPTLSDFWTDPPRILDVRAFIITHSLNRSELADDTSFLQQLDLDPFLVDLFTMHNGTVHAQFLDKVNHANAPLSYYFPDCDVRTLRSMPIEFVGTQESMQHDFDNFTKKYNCGIELPHTHATHQRTRSLSRLAVTMLRKYYAKDYFCIANFVDQQWVSPEYMLNITSDSKTYYY